MIEVSLHPDANRPAVLTELRGFGIVFERMILKTAVAVACDVSEIPRIKLIPGVLDARDGNEMTMKSNGVIQTMDFYAKDVDVNYVPNRLNLKMMDLDKYVPLPKDLAVSPRRFKFQRDKDGEGVEIAVTDTGMIGDLNMFGDRYLGRIYDGYSAEAYHPHSTMVASVAAGSISGFAPAAGIVDARLFNASNAGSTSIAINAWDAVGARHLAGSVNTVLNFSGSSTQSFNPWGTIVAEIIGLGVPFVAAAGNDGEDLDIVGKYSWPADDSNCFAVGGLNQQGRIDSASNFGATVDLYGDYRLHPLLNNAGRTIFGVGTSFACPQIAGAMACELQGRPKMTNSAQVYSFYQEFRNKGVSGYFDVNGNPNKSIKKLYYPVTGIPSYEAAPSVPKNPGIIKKLWSQNNPPSYTSRVGVHLTMNGILSDFGTYKKSIYDGTFVKGWQDDSGNANRYSRSSDTNAPTFDAANGALVFNAANQTSLGGLTKPSSVSGTIGARLMQTGSGTGYEIVFGCQSGSNRNWIAMNNGVFNAGLARLSGSVFRDPTETNRRNQWLTLFVTWSGNVGRLYFNGSFIRTDTFAGTIPISSAQIVGARWIGASQDLYFTGKVSHVMASDIVLSDQEIALVHDMWVQEAADYAANWVDPGPAP